MGVVTGTAAAIVVANSSTVQNLDPLQLKQILVRDGARVDLPTTPGANEYNISGAGDTAVNGIYTVRCCDWSSTVVCHAGSQKVSFTERPISEP